MSDDNLTPTAGLKVGDRYEQGKWIWEVVQVSDDRAIVRRFGKVLIAAQSVESSVWRNADVKDA